MKHIDLSKTAVNGLAKHMVTIESNNFGDQILSYKRLIRVNETSYYETASMRVESEGSWLSDTEIKAYYRELKKRGVL